MSLSGQLLGKTTDGRYFIGADTIILKPEDTSDDEPPEAGSDGISDGDNGKSNGKGGRKK